MDGSINQFPEQVARDNIDRQLRAAGWAVQDKDKINWNESIGIAIRGYHNYTPFDAYGGRDMMFKLFGNGMNSVISEMNEALAV